MSLYNLTHVAKANTTVEFIRRANDELMYGWYGVGLLVSLGVILFLGFLSQTGDARKSLAGTSFICMILSIVMKTMYLVPDLAVFVCVALTGLSVILASKE